MMEKEKNATEGIGFLANMDDWHFDNFNVNYCYQFMMVLQGRIPARVRLFLIVNPPKWFGAIWKIMKPMLSSDFRKKVYMIPESELGEHLMAGYESYLPDDVKSGRAPTDAMVQDFVTYRKLAEASSSSSSS
jgi:CRAL/TRIO domain